MNVMDLPLVTLIMPIRNEEAFIERSLGAVLGQDYPADRLQILVVDGMSTDATLDVIRNMEGVQRVRVLQNPRRIQAAAINVGIEQAAGAVVVRVDGHTVIAPDYVRQCVETLQTTGAQNVGGAMDPVGESPMGQAIALAGKSPFAVPTAFHVSQQAQYTDTVYLGAWPLAVLRDLGGFNPTLVINEDYELNYRIRQAGGRIFFNPAIRSLYYGRQTLQALRLQYFRYGVGKTRVLRLHPASLRPRQMVAPLFVAGLVGGIPLGLLSPVLSMLWLLGILAYLALSVLFSLRAMRGTANWRVAWRLPIVFLTIHLAWGTGFWVGLLRGGR